MEAMVRCAVDHACRRNKRLEPALTKAMALLLATDAGAAKEFARVVVGAADPTAVRDLPVTIKHECAFDAGFAGSRSRRADLLLRDDAGSHGLIVEAKLGSQCHYRQIADYLRCPAERLDLQQDAHVDVVLLATRALAPDLGPRRSRSRDRWRGCVTWIEVIGELQAISFSDEETRDQWTRLLNHFRHRASFGTSAKTYLEAAPTLNAGIGRIVAAMSEAGASRGVDVWADPWRRNSQLVVSGNAARASARIQILGRAAQGCEVVVTYDRTGRRGTAHFVRTSFRKSRDREWSITVPKAWEGATTAIAKELSVYIAAGDLP